MKVLLQAKLFVGVSSGMSHLAASANTPTFIYLKGGSPQ
jgi:ADP-heptose:LPS heptosyltransferase